MFFWLCKWFIDIFMKIIFEVRKYEVNNFYIYGWVLSLSWYFDSNGIMNWKNKFIIVKKFIILKIVIVFFIFLRLVLCIIFI